MATTRATRTTDLPPKVASTPVDDSAFSDGSGIPDLDLSDIVETRKSPKETEIILASLTKTYVMIAQIVTLFNVKDGVTIASNIGDLTESWRTLLDDDPKLRKRMLVMAKASGWGAVFAAHAVVALPIVVNHRDDFGHLVKRKDTDE